MKQKLKFHLITPVWGEKFIGSYLEYVIPNQLSPQNLPALSHLAACEYKIYTTKKDAHRLTSTDAVEKLKKVMKVEIIDSIDEDLPDHHAKMTAAHHDALTKAKEDGALIIFLAPDAIFSDGSLEYLADLALSGKTCVFCSSFRLNKETFLPLLAKHKGATGDLNLSTKDFLALGLKNLHPLTLASSMGRKDKKITPWPAYVIWPHPTGIENGFLMKAFHLHPILFDPALSSSFSDTIDGTMVSKIYDKSSDNIEVISRPEKFLYLEFSDPKHLTQILRRRSFLFHKYLMHFIADNCNPAHLQFVRKNIVYSNNPEDPVWDKLTIEAQDYLDVGIRAVQRLQKNKYFPLIDTLSRPWYKGRVICDYVYQNWGWPGRRMAEAAIGLNSVRKAIVELANSKKKLI